MTKDKDTKEFKSAAKFGARFGFTPQEVSAIWHREAMYRSTCHRYVTLDIRLSESKEAVSRAVKQEIRETRAAELAQIKAIEKRERTRAQVQAG